MGELIENQLTGVTKIGHDAEGNRTVRVAYIDPGEGVWGRVGYAFHRFVSLGGEGWRKKRAKSFNSFSFFT